MAPAPPAARAKDTAFSPGFEEQFFLAVRRAAPLAASAGLHGAAILLALWLTPDAPGAGLPGGSLEFSPGAVLGPEEDSGPEADGLPATLSSRETPPDATPEPEPAAPPGPRPDPEDAEPARLPPATRGGEIPLTLATAGKRRPPAEDPGPVEFDGNPAFRGDGAAGANREASGLVQRSLGGRGSGERALLCRLDPRRVLVVRGCYDHAERILALLGVRHDTLDPAEIPVAPLDPGAVLVVDCGVEALGPDAAAAVRGFVAAGGYLVTTDWGVENVLEPAFPGVLRSLRRRGRGVTAREEIVPFLVAAPDHPLARGLAPLEGGGSWWVEDQAYPVEVVDAKRVTVLAESPVLGRRYGGPVLAATFEWGKGRVLHLLGHAWQKEGDLKGAFAIQRLLVNFLLERAGEKPPERTSIAR